MFKNAGTLKKWNGFLPTPFLVSGYVQWTQGPGLGQPSCSVSSQPHLCHGTGVAYLEIPAGRHLLCSVSGKLLLGKIFFAATFFFFVSFLLKKNWKVQNKSGAGTSKAAVLALHYGMQQCARDVRDPNGTCWVSFKVENTGGFCIWHLQHLCDPQAEPTWIPRQPEGTSTLQPEAKPVEIVETLLV